jgi:hypothetical protein
MRKVFINRKTLTIIIAKEQNYLEYENNSEYCYLCQGTKKECDLQIEAYWDENYITDEQQIILND